MHTFLIVNAVILILVFQIISLVQTRRRMKSYSTIFGDEVPYEYQLIYENDDEEAEICGFKVAYMKGENENFARINKSINDYVKNNEIIDFQLIKDIVNSDCDALEEDVHSQIPIPLYLGLAGTMLGIIIGVGSLVLSGNLSDLLSTTGSSESSGDGIVALFQGVALAMGCSIIGLVITTVCTWSFKGCRLTTERRKSDLFTWLQQNLLPKVAQSDVQAINKISRSLSRFNATFKQQSDNFSASLNSISSIISKLEKTALVVEQMGENASQMAKNNELATERLEKNAMVLQHFNDYIESITGYVDEVHRFTENFRDETLRLQVLDKITESHESVKEFFEAQKGPIIAYQNEMSKHVGKLDNEFKGAVDLLKENMMNEVNELAKVASQRNDNLGQALKEQEAIVKESSNRVLADLEQQIRNLGMATAGLTVIPNQIGELADSIERSNKEHREFMKEQETALNENANKVFANLEQQISNIAVATEGLKVIPNYIGQLAESIAQSNKAQQEFMQKVLREFQRTSTKPVVLQKFQPKAPAEPSVQVAPQNVEVKPNGVSFADRIKGLFKKK